jgi:hypothetical protein
VAALLAACAVSCWADEDQTQDAAWGATDTPAAEQWWNEHYGSEVVSGTGSVTNGAGQPMSLTNHEWSDTRMWGDPKNLCAVPEDWCAPRANQRPCTGLYVFQQFDTFRGWPDGSSPNNGVVQGFNLGRPLPGLCEYGIGYQFGASFGDYNFSGNGSRADQGLQQQTMFTTGFFRRADGDRTVSLALVYDWMLNDNFGFFSQSPTMSQGRVQYGWAMTARNEFGLLAMWRDQGAQRFAPGGPVHYRGVSQGRLFWHHKLIRPGADAWLWAGMPDDVRANGDRGLGNMFFGGSMNWPVTNSVSLFTNWQWMSPAGGASREPIYHVAVGASWTFGRAARSSTVAGHKWMPLAPVADNALFMTDASRAQ